MPLSLILSSSIASAIARDLAAAAEGHCLRVDYLSKDEALEICRDVRTRTAAAGIDASVFVLDSGAATDGLTIRPENAIELRNLKRGRLCLVIPSDVGESSSSSLTNSFAAFDVHTALRVAGEELLVSLPSDVRSLATSALNILRGSARPAAQDWAEYLAAVAANPTVPVAGAELWRLGLIPDPKSDGVFDRLTDNARCARELIRASRPQSTVAQRLDGMGMRPGPIAESLKAFLAGKRMRDWRTWLRLLGEPPLVDQLGFASWPIETTAPSDLIAIEIQPFLDRHGAVEKWTGLIQPAGAGTQPEALIGTKSKITVRWRSVPSDPVNIARWLLTLVPSAEEHTEQELAGVELPETFVAGSRRRGALLLDLDLEAIQIRAVRVQVRAADPSGAIVKSVDGRPLEATSDEFWLSDETAPAPSPGRTKRETATTIPIARLRAAQELRVDQLDDAPGQWTEKDLDYYSVTLNGRRRTSIALSRPLRFLEALALEQPASLGAYSAKVRIGSVLDPTADLETGDISAIAGLPQLDTFTARRRDLFKALRLQGPAGLVETAVWNEDLTARARSYSRAYRDLLRAVPDGPLAAAALRIDTLALQIQGDQRTHSSILVLPTHPLRILWYAAYVDLLRMWERQLLSLEKGRSEALDATLLERVTPINCPAFVLGPEGDPYLFTRNLQFFWGLALPIEAADVNRRTSEIARALGLDDDEISLADLSPSRVSSGIATYTSVHPYVKTLRLSAINVGSGQYIADVLRSYYATVLSTDSASANEGPPVAKLDVVAIVYPPAPAQLRPLTSLATELYEAQPNGIPNALAPWFAHAVRDLTQDSLGPDRDVNVTLAFDVVRPTISLSPDEGSGESSSFFGLLMRLSPHLSEHEGSVLWTYGLSLPLDRLRERHPHLPQYTTDLVDLHRECQHAVGRAVGGTGLQRPAVIMHLGAADRRRIDDIHRSSDWVITVDRFFGPEFFDDPRARGLRQEGDQYLLDYVPEFLDGFGHRMFVTTSQRDEVEQILSRAMADLGFGLVEDSVGEVLAHLKMISGRLALRVIGDDARAREAVSLGAVAAFLQSRDELTDAILVPVDMHPELFGPHRPRSENAPGLRCDLIRFRFSRSRLEATFIEVKSRSSIGQPDELLSRIADQVESTEHLLRDLFFRHKDVRIDAPLQRSRLVSLLRFYLGRSIRYGLISSEQKASDLSLAISKLESGSPELRALRQGYIVNLSAKPEPPVRHRETLIQFVTASDFHDTGLSALASEDLTT